MPITKLDAGRRVTLIGAPCGLGAGTRGTELGPAALRLSGLIEAIAALGCIVTDHGDLKPASAMANEAGQGAAIPGKHGHEIAAWLADIHDHVLASLRAGECPVLLGGDHALAMGSVSAAARHAAEEGKRLVVLWVDAHADFNTPETSPSGNLHGMSVAFLIGNHSLPPLLAGREFPAIPPADMRIIGVRSVDAEEKHRLASAGLTCLDMRAIDELGIVTALRQSLDGLERDTTLLHVSFDIDVVAPEIAPGTGTRAEGGLTYREAHLMMELLAESGLVSSLDLVELNPMLDHAGMTARLMVDLVASLFGKTIIAR